MSGGRVNSGDIAVLELVLIRSVKLHPRTCARVRFDQNYLERKRSLRDKWQGACPGAPAGAVLTGCRVVGKSSQNAIDMSRDQGISRASDETQSEMKEDDVVSTEGGESQRKSKRLNCQKSPQQSDAARHPMPTQSDDRRSV